VSQWARDLISKGDLSKKHVRKQSFFVITGYIISFENPNGLLETQKINY